jgi:hypothetical protein
MNDNRPCRNDEGWRMCRLRWWLADRFRGRRVFNRVSYPGGGYFIDGGRIDPTIYRAAEGELDMDIHIYDEEEVP